MKTKMLQVREPKPEQPVVTTVREAQKLSGPGTSVYWRPENFELQSDPLNDTAIVKHVSTSVDVYHANLARERERLQQELLGRLN